MKPILILCSVPDTEVGLRLSRILVEQSLVACGQVLPKITSIYRWENKVCEETESLLLLKTLKSKYKDIEHFLITNHPYSTPEIVGIEIDQINKKYLDWMLSVTNNSND